MNNPLGTILSTDPAARTDAVIPPLVSAQEHCNRGPLSQELFDLAVEIMRLQKWNRDWEWRTP